MNSFIKEQMILFDYRQKNNWFLDLDEEVENNPLENIPPPLDYILFDETSFHLLSNVCQLQSDKEEPFDFKKPNIQDIPKIPEKSTEDKKVVSKAKKIFYKKKKKQKDL